MSFPEGNNTFTVLSPAVKDLNEENFRKDLLKVFFGHGPREHGCTIGSVQKSWMLAYLKT